MGNGQGLHKFIDVDVIAFLQKKAEGNTLHYMSDFDLDIDILTQYASSSRKEDKDLLWMSRPCGTWCHRAHEVFIQDTAANQTWNYYANSGDTILACAVELTGIQDGKIRGNVYELDYPSLAKKIEAKAVAPLEVEKTFESGHTYRASMDRSCYSLYFGLIERYGPIIYSKTYPKDEFDLSAVLGEQKESRDKLPLGCFEPERGKSSLSAKISSATSRISSQSSHNKPKTAEHSL